MSEMLRQEGARQESGEREPKIIEAIDRLQANKKFQGKAKPIRVLHAAYYEFERAHNADAGPETPYYHHMFNANYWFDQHGEEVAALVLGLDAGDMQKLEANYAACWDRMKHPAGHKSGRDVWWSGKLTCTPADFARVAVPEKARCVACGTLLRFQPKNDPRIDDGGPDKLSKKFAAYFNPLGCHGYGGAGEGYIVRDAVADMFAGIGAARGLLARLDEDIRAFELLMPPDESRGSSRYKPADPALCMKILAVVMRQGKNAFLSSGLWEESHLLAQIARKLYEAHDAQAATEADRVRNRLWYERIADAIEAYSNLAVPEADGDGFGIPAGSSGAVQNGQELPDAVARRFQVPAVFPGTPQDEPCELCGLPDARRAMPPAKTPQALALAKRFAVTPPGADWYYAGYPGEDNPRFSLKQLIIYNMLICAITGTKSMEPALTDEGDYTAVDIAGSDENYRANRITADDESFLVVEQNVRGGRVVGVGTCVRVPISRGAHVKGQPSLLTIGRDPAGKLAVSVRCAIGAGLHARQHTVFTGTGEDVLPTGFAKHSRNHLAFAVLGQYVYAVDLGSTNGTRIRRGTQCFYLPGRPLGPGDSAKRQEKHRARIQEAQETGSLVEGNALIICRGDIIELPGSFYQIV